MAKEKPSAEPELIFIDSKEESKQHWAVEFRQYGWNPSVVPLDYGDFKFFALGMSFPIERKACPTDLEASFIDGRLARFVAKCEENPEEQGILLIEGDILKCKNYTGISHAVFEAQTKGVLVHHCGVGEVTGALTALHKFLSKIDHSMYRKPVVELPSKYQYARTFDGSVGRFERVKTLMTFRGVSEDVAVDALKVYSLEEILSNPSIMRRFLRTAKDKTISRMYEHLQIERGRKIEGREIGTEAKAEAQVELLSFDRRESLSGTAQEQQ